MDVEWLWFTLLASDAKRAYSSTWQQPGGPAENGCKCEEYVVYLTHYFPFPPQQGHAMGGRLDNHGICRVETVPRKILGSVGVLTGPSRAIVARLLSAPPDWLP